MKGKKFYALLFGLLLIGISSVYFYQQQEEARVLKFEGYEISVIEDRVDALYNEDKTDLAKDISEDELEELDAIFIDLSENDLSKRSRDRITRTEVDFLMAREMYLIEEEVKDLFQEDGLVDTNLSLDKIDPLEEKVTVYEIKPVYYDRNIRLLQDAKQQVTDIETVHALVEALFDENGNLHEDVTREDEAEVLEHIEDLKNPALKRQLTAQIEEDVSQVLAEREEALALELEAELEEAEEETMETGEEAEEETSTSNNRRPTSTSEQATPPRTPNRTPDRTPGGSGTTNQTRPGNSNTPSNPPSNGEGPPEAPRDDSRPDGSGQPTDGDNDIEDDQNKDETEEEEVIPTIPSPNPGGNDNENEGNQDGDQLPPDER